MFKYKLHLTYRITDIKYQGGYKNGKRKRLLLIDLSYGCDEQGCGCCEEESSCGQNERCEGEYDKMAMMMYLAKSAKMELIKEKIKKKLESAHGKKLDQIADLLVEAMMEKHKSSMDFEKKMQSFRERLEAIFMES